MIRNAEPKDFPAILELSAEFWLHTMFSEPFEHEHTLRMVEQAYSHGLLAVVEIKGEVVGFTAGVKSFLLASTKALVATELAWWISPDHRGGKSGIKLLRHIETQAKSQGIKYWSMVTMESSAPEMVAKMYERMGYSKSETIYTKVL